MKLILLIFRHYPTLYALIAPSSPPGQPRKYMILLATPLVGLSESDCSHSPPKGMHASSRLHAHVLEHTR